MKRKHKKLCMCGRPWGEPVHRVALCPVAFASGGECECHHPFLMLDGATTKTPGATCPNCFELVDGATALDGNDKPWAGCLSVCGLCGAYLVFMEGLQLRRATNYDLSTLRERQPETYLLLTRFSLRVKIRRVAKNQRPDSEGH